MVWVKYFKIYDVSIVLVWKECVKFYLDFIMIELFDDVRWMFILVRYLYWNCFVVCGLYSGDERKIWWIMFFMFLVLI